MMYSEGTAKILKLVASFLIKIIELINILIYDIGTIISRRNIEEYDDLISELGPIVIEWFNCIYFYLYPREMSIFNDGYANLFKRLGRIDWSIKNYYTSINKDGTAIDEFQKQSILKLAKEIRTNEINNLDAAELKDKLTRLLGFNADTLATSLPPHIIKNHLKIKIDRIEAVIKIMEQEHKKFQNELLFLYRTRTATRLHRGTSSPLKIKMDTYCQEKSINVNDTEIKNFDIHNLMDIFNYN